MPRDLFNREIDYLRISVIDRCNLRSVYCMPVNEIRFQPRAELLTPSEIEAVVEAAVRVGFRKFRLTGDEPTLRLYLLIVQRIARVPGVGDLALTANAVASAVEVRFEKERGPDEHRCSDDKSSRWNCGHYTGQRKAHLF
jgi:cyclic pyranopterin phosphate synthase